MAEQKILTFALMDAPFEQSRTTTTFRLMHIAAKRGYKINVFAYEGAVGLPFNLQKQHANAVHGRSLEQENHPLPKDWVAALMRETERNGGKLDWVNCGLCVEERGAGDAIQGVRRGSPGDFLKFAQESTNTLVISTK